MLRHNTQNTKLHLDGLFELVLGLVLPRNRSGSPDIPAWLDRQAQSGSASALTFLGELRLGNAVSGEAQAEALRLLHEAGQKGYAPAQLRIGALLALGVTGVPDPEAALPWLKQAATQGMVEAATLLGMLYATGDGVDKDPDMADSLFQKAADGGEVTAKRWLSQNLPIVKQLVSSTLLGMLRALAGAACTLYDDSGDAEMIASLVRISEGGDANASLLLATIYTEGKMVEPNATLADRWYARAAEQGSLLAPLLQNPLTAVADDIMQAPEDAIRVLTVLAQSGDRDMQFLLAVFHRMREDREPNLEEAAKWLRAAAEQGHSEAPYFLGNALGKGEGVTKDEAEAAHWFHIAAELGNAGAQLMLAHAFNNGSGVVADKAEALRWYARAAEQGNTGAGYMLAMLLHQQGDRSAAAAQMQISATEGHPRAQAVLSIWYDIGSGVERDIELSEHWARAAIANDPDVFSETVVAMMGT